jgi:putative FmdB family regulatory protein
MAVMRQFATWTAEGRMLMPTYEFLCPKCQKEFTVTMTIRERGEKQPACPHCGSTDLESLFSSIVTKTSRKS